METLIFTASELLQAACQATFPATEGGSWRSDELICVHRFLTLGAWKCAFCADGRNGALTTLSVSKLKYLQDCGFHLESNALFGSFFFLALATGPWGFRGCVWKALAVTAVF